MFSTSLQSAELSESWLDGDSAARWRSTAGHGPDQGARASGSSLLEVDPGCRLPRHTDSAEEVVVIIDGNASITVGDETSEVGAGGVALVPECVPHEVRNAGDSVLRFAAIYAGTAVTTTYERDVQPDGTPEQDPLP